MPDFSGAIALLRKPIEDLYSSTSGAVKQKIGTLRTESKASKLHQKLWESQKVKTIWNTDRPLSLTTFFHPVFVSEQGQSNGAKLKLTTLDDLPNNQNLIFGTVGQGKSILLRYLLGREIKSGTRIPVLCELRNIVNTTLEEYLCTRFSLLLSVKYDLEIFQKFAVNGKISFLLDGFDEIDPSNVQQIMHEIEDFSFRYPNCKIILSSRPDSDCRHLTNFCINRISPLELQDLESFYKKITKDNDFSNRLVAAIKISPTKIQDLVKTPLLATLLAISYRTAHKIPLNFAEFYDDLFEILLVRHDGSKQGWRRSRKTKLNDREIQQIFETFCFASRKKQVTSIDRELAFSLSKESIQETKLEVDPQHFLDDIRKVTCLLVDEDKKISFVHASVQEFFAARYIKNRTEPVAKKIYTSMFNGKWSYWKEELLFLRQIDAHRANKYFVLPDLESTISELISKTSSLDNAVLRYLDKLKIKRVITQRDGKEFSSYHVMKPLREKFTESFDSLDSKAFNILFSMKIPNTKPWQSGFMLDQDRMERTYKEIADDKGGNTSEILRSALKSAIQDQISISQNLRIEIDKDETPTDFMDI